MRIRDGGGCPPPPWERRKEGGRGGPEEGPGCLGVGEGWSGEGESRDRGFFSLGFIKWNLKGNIEPEGGFLITSL